MKKTKITSKRSKVNFSISFTFSKFKYCKHCSKTGAFAFLVPTGAHRISYDQYRDLQIPIDLSGPKVQYCNVFNNKMRRSAKTNQSVIVSCPCAKTLWYVDSEWTYSTKPYVLQRRSNQRYTINISVF